MRYEEFRSRVETFLHAHPEGVTWKGLRARLRLPYETPCYAWVYRMESEDGLRRSRGPRGMIWQMEPRDRPGRR